MRALSVTFDTGPVNTALIYFDVLFSMNTRRFWALIFLAAAVSLHGQAPADSLGLARALKEQGKYTKASRLLAAWFNSQPRTSGELWLYAQCRAGQKQYRAARELYAEASAAAPGNLYLSLDHAAFLLNAGRYRDAALLLDELPADAQQDPYALRLRATWHYWRGDLAGARRYIEASAKASGQPETLALLDEITGVTSPWAGAAARLQRDDQPLQRMALQLEGGAWRHNLAELRGGVEYLRFRRDSAQGPAMQAELHNSLRFPALGARLEAGMGLFQFQGQSAWLTGGIGLVQRVAPGLELSARIERQPYLTTRASLDSALLSKLFSASATWRQRHGFLLQAGASSEVFPDNNRIASYWAWALTPALRAGPLSLRIGYAWSFANSAESRFVSEKSLEELLNPFDPDAQLKGVFAPYFTPANMFISAAMATTEWHLAKGLNLYVDGKYGFAAAADNPYLFIDLDTGSSSTLEIRRGFLETAFTPIELKARISAQMGRHLLAEAQYAFNRIFFYEAQSALLSLKYSFAP